jgi:hypothetical protein
MDDLKVYHWTGWVACASAILCLVAIPSMYAGAVDTNDFYNVAGVPQSWPTSRR